MDELILKFKHVKTLYTNTYVVDTVVNFNRTKTNLYTFRTVIMLHLNPEENSRDRYSPIDKRFCGLKRF